jgi:ABC-type multidrug transport system fused ATPase/permease subunit
MVAHRLDTAVTYCEKIMVLELGELAQFDNPGALLKENPSDKSVTK